MNDMDKLRDLLLNREFKITDELIEEITQIMDRKVLPVELEIPEMLLDELGENVIERNAQKGNK